MGKRSRLEDLARAVHEALTKHSAEIDRAADLSSLRIDIKLRPGDGAVRKVIVSLQTEQRLEDADEGD